MGIVTLVSGGLDSTLMAVLTKEAGIVQFPIFINYGQRALRQELSSCRRSLRRHRIPKPAIMNLPGFGVLIRSGLTDPSLHIFEDAFTPGRNLLFLLLAAAYAYQVQADAVSIGLLDERTSLFPDQTSQFILSAESLLSDCMGRRIKVLAPLIGFTKSDVVEIARKKKIRGTYSCHVGRTRPCGKCISCREFDLKEGPNGRRRRQ
jgi:7-cyano-7-deazaguanine synthase